jgi:hypothetical protein
MHTELSEYTTEALLAMINDDVDRGTDFNYEAHECLFKRWRAGRDLAPLIALIRSEKSSKRMRGAYYIGEADPRSDHFAAAALVMAKDPLAYCRMKFVGYMSNTGLYSDEIGVALARTMIDDTLTVRIATIRWAAYTTDARFEEICSLVRAGTGSASVEPWRTSDIKRGLRALEIVRRLRSGDSVAALRTEIYEEDSATFDYLERFERRLRDYAKRRREGLIIIGPDGFEEYEVGVLGETYDNLGKLKGELPAWPRR